MSAMRTVFRIQEMVRKAAYKCFREVVLKKSLKSCGGGVHIAQCCDIKGIENISIGAGSSIGPGSVLWTTRANILIDEKVITGPYHYHYRQSQDEYTRQVHGGCNGCGKGAFRR